MSQQELLRDVVAALDKLKIPYMLTGSAVSSLQGEPRSSHDIDFVVELDGQQAPQLADLFKAPDYYLDEYSIRDAVATGEMFNLLHIKSGDKVDFWMLTDTPFDRCRFSRRREATVFGTRVYVSTAEDTLLQKLSWADKYQSDKQFGDALGVYDVQKASLDTSYVQQWILRLGLSKVWERLQREST